jgi:hypothetical protein
MSDLDVAPVPRVVDIHAAGQLLGGEGRSFIYELLDAGDLQSVKVGRRRMVLVASVDELIDWLRIKASECSAF